MLNKIAGRILAMVGIGRVTTSNDAGVVQMLQVKFNDMQTINNLPRIMEFGFTSTMPDGSDVLAIFMGGDKSNGAVIASNHQDSRPKGLAEGETALFNQVGIVIYLSTAGIVIEGAGLPMTINNTPVVTINASTEVNLNTPTLKVSGDILAGGNITDLADSVAISMAEMREDHNEHDHNVVNVMTGGATITTTVPLVQE